jgi:6-phosphofructokinase 1
LQRGGSPSAGDRILATRLGFACAEFLNREKYGIMVALKGDGTKAIPLEQVAGKKKFIPLDHPWIHSARYVETCLGI